MGGAHLRFQEAPPGQRGEAWEGRQAALEAQSTHKAHRQPMAPEAGSCGLQQDARAPWKTWLEEGAPSQQGSWRSDRSASVSASDACLRS